MPTNAIQLSHLCLDIGQQMLFSYLIPETVVLFMSAELFVYVSIDVSVMKPFYENG